MKNFKKILLFLISLLMIIMCGCGQERTAPDNLTESVEYAVFELEGFDANDAGDHIVEYVLEESVDQNAVPPQYTTITFGDKTYTGEYRTRYKHTFGDSYKYSFDNGFFEINQATGNFMGIMFNDAVKINASGSIDCRKIADAVAEKYINIDDFYVTEEKIELLSSDDYNYCYEYLRMINGYKTTDNLSVVVNRNGEIKSFFIKTLNSFENITEYKFDDVKINAAIETKLKSIYKNQPWQGYSVKNTVITKLPDGEIGLIYTINNSFEKKTEEGVYSYGSVLQLLVKQE